MARRAEIKSQPTSKSTDSNLTEPQNTLTGAAEQVSPQILDALAFAYRWALENRDGRSIELEMPYSGDLEFEDEDSEVKSFEEFVPPADDFALERSPLAPQRDITGDVFQCIFSAFSKRGIPITTQTKPSDVLSLEMWVGVGRAILFCVAKKYPQFGPVAMPTKLPGFYSQTLSTLAKAIKTSIVKHS